MSCEKIGMLSDLAQRVLSSELSVYPKPFVLLDLFSSDVVHLCIISQMYLL